MKSYAAKNGIALGSEHIFMSPKSIAHATRKSKQAKGLVVSDSELIEFPVSRRKMELYYDGECFIYTNRKSKFVIHPNYQMPTGRGKVRRVNFITAGVVREPSEFDMLKYKKV